MLACNARYRMPIFERLFRNPYGLFAGAHGVHTDIETCVKVAKSARLAKRGLPYLPALLLILPCDDVAVTSEVACFLSRTSRHETPDLSNNRTKLLLYMEPLFSKT